MALFKETFQSKSQLRKFCSEILSNMNQFEELNHKKIKELKVKLEKRLY